MITWERRDGAHWADAGEIDLMVEYIACGVYAWALHGGIPEEDRPLLTGQEHSFDNACAAAEKAATDFAKSILDAFSA